MNNSLIIWTSFAVISIISGLLIIFRLRIIRYLQRLSTKYSLATLRQAIHAADEDKKKTGRKNIVIYNTDTRQFESVQKKKLKQLSMIQKRMKSKNRISASKIRQTEKKSLYVTR